MAQFNQGDKVKIRKPPHIFEGVIIMPGSLAEVSEVNPDGTYSLLYHDREMMPHTMKNIRPEEIEKA